jgi:hypothetical protein
MFTGVFKIASYLTSLNDPSNESREKWWWNHSFFFRRREGGGRGSAGILADPEPGQRRQYSKECRARRAGNP